MKVTFKKQAFAVFMLIVAQLLFAGCAPFSSSQQSAVQQQIVSSPTAISTPTPVVTCAQISGFQNKRDAASLVESNFKSGYGDFSGMILPQHAVGYEIGTSDVALHDQRDTQFHFQRIAVCVDGVTPGAIRTFYANGMTENGWTQSAVYPYKGQLQAACGDPYCWEDIVGGGNIFWLSLEAVQQHGSATTFQLRMAYESLLEIIGPLKGGVITPTRTYVASGSSR